jgi:hypothetical protein
MMVFLRIVILLHLLFEQDLFSENRFPLFRIILQAERDRMTGRGRDAGNNTVQTQSKTQCPDASVLMLSSRRAGAKNGPRSKPGPLFSHSLHQAAICSACHCEI